MNNRIKILRKDILGLTQKEFAEKVGTGSNNIACYETGKNVPSNAVITLICKTFNVNEKWLRTGEGEALVPITTNQQILAWANEVMSNEDEAFRKRFVTALTHTNHDFWKQLEQICLDSVGMTKEELNAFYENRKMETSDSYQNIPGTPDEFEAKYPPVDSNEVSNAKTK